MAAVTVRQFLSRVPDEAVTYLQVLSGDTGQPDKRNPIMQVAVTQAYSQVVGYTKRKWLADNYCENHVLEGGESVIKIKEAPLDTLTSVILKSTPGNDQLLTEDEDYIIERNNIRFLSTATFDAFVLGDDLLDIRERVFELLYLGGYESAHSNDQLFQALAIQAAANYKRAPVTGLQTITGGSQTGSITQTSNAGGLINTAAEILAPLTYEGTAFDC